MLYEQLYIKPKKRDNLHGGIHTPEAAEEFLEDCMAVVCKNIKEVRDYFDEAGSDISGMSDDELMDQSEVFAIADGRFLVVEG